MSKIIGESTCGFGRSPVSKEGFKYCIGFTDDFSGAVLETFLADITPYGKVSCIRYLPQVRHFKHY